MITRQQCLADAYSVRCKSRLCRGRTHKLVRTEWQAIKEWNRRAGYRKQSEGENEYKKLYEQLLEDFEHALHYAGKNNNVCNFCGNDCGEGGACKGREDWIECNPKWRGIVKGGAEE